MAQEKLSESIKNKLSPLGFHSLAIDCAEFTIQGSKKVLENGGLTRDKLGLEIKAGDKTIVTKADKEANNAIDFAIREKYPEDGRKGEESNEVEGGNRRWIWDPLDGTTVFSWGHRFSATTILAEEGRVTQTAAIVDPFEKSLLIGQLGGPIYQIGLDDTLIPTNQKWAVSMPQPADGKMTVFLDSALRETTAFTKSQLIAALPQGLGVEVSLLSVGSNVNNQRLAITRGHLWITDAIGGPWDILSGAFLTGLAGGVSTDRNGNLVTAETRDIAVGSCNPEVHEILLRTISISMAGYKHFTTG
jgi:fructose-1,6-bisphosphatase/inositol monophosphatase family enzyme